MSATPLRWQGRVDAEETGDATRWHQRVRPAAEGGQGGVTLLGFAVDEGVRRNLGRPGAADGPRALRQSLASLPVLGEPALWDGGDVDCADGDLDAAQSRLASAVAAAIDHGSLPLVLGGGHEVAYGTFQGVAQARPGIRRPLVVNLDAHFDLRAAAQANSGTPFRQIAERCAADGRPFDYRVFGISRFANTQALFDRAQALGVRWWADEDLQSDAGVDAASAALTADLAHADAVYLTVCLDVLPAAQAPGVSAPAALGVPLAGVERLIDTVLASGLVVAADVAELNPALDRDGLTARVAARLVARIARGHAAARAGGPAS